VADHTIALAGNPNTGKSTVFNALTGGRQHVGNWPGKTVARKTGTLDHAGRRYAVVDLPGTYSLSAYSLEEIIARQHLVEERPDVVVVVVDAANLERNLYLTAQILEMRGGVVIALNMADAAAAKGLSIDVEALARRLGAPVVETTARSGRGIEALKAAIAGLVDEPLSATAEQAAPPATAPGVHIDYGTEVEAEIRSLAQALEAEPGLRAGRGARWLAVKLLEGDPDIAARLSGLAGGAAMIAAAAAAAERLRCALGEDADTLIADGRYTWIHAMVREVVQAPPIERVTLSDRIDAVVTHRLLGIPVFLLAMAAAFRITTDVSGPLLEWIAAVFDGPLANQATRLLERAGLGGTWFQGLVVDGALAGVGGVLVFVPVLLSLYFVLAVLEDSGYMARAAFVMDRLMQGIGLHGKSFLPMLVGFGCTVPAIYATRTMRTERDRILTGLLVPFMSCGARLPVYVLFAAVFFPRHGGSIVFAMYLIGIGTAVVLGALLNRSLFRAARSAPFVMELPPYRMPTARAVLAHMWVRTSGFIRRAGTIILVVSVVLWALTAIPAGDGTFGDTPVEDSLFAGVAGAATPLFAPLGFDSWQAAGALVTGLLAKEVVVATMAQVYGAEVADEPPADATPGLVEDARFVVTGLARALADTARAVPAIVGLRPFDGEAEETPSALKVAIHADFSRSSDGHPTLAGLAFMVFVLLYTPCMAAVAASRHEFGARWMWTSVLGQFAVAWLTALVVFQGGRLLAG